MSLVILRRGGSMIDGWVRDPKIRRHALTSIARQQHTTLRLVVATHAVRRVLSITGLDQTLTVYPVLEPALAV